MHAVRGTVRPSKLHRRLVRERSLSRKPRCQREAQRVCRPQRTVQNKRKNRDSQRNSAPFATIAQQKRVLLVQVRQSTASVVVRRQE